MLALMGLVMAESSIVIIILELVPFLIILATVCCNLPQWLFKIGSVFGVVSAVGAFVWATQPLCENDPTSSCTNERDRKVSIVVGVIWITAAALFCMIPTRQDDSSPETSNSTRTPQRGDDSEIA